MGSLTCKQKHKKMDTCFAALAYVLDISRVNSQAIYALNTMDTSRKSFEFGWELMIVILRNPSGYTLVKLERSIPHPHTMVKHKHVEYARKKSMIQVTKKQSTL